MSKNTQFSIKKIPTNRPLGKLIFDGPHTLRPHEIKTLEMLRKFGDPITHIAPSRIPNIKTPDINWRNTLWEIKTISGISHDNIVHALSAAKKQSNHIVICIHKTRRNPNVILREVGTFIKRSSTIKDVLVIINNEYCILNK